MIKVFFVIPDAEYGSAATQIGLLTRALPGDLFSCRVCVLGKTGPVAEQLRRSGVAVEVLGCRGFLDFGPLWRLRDLLRESRPDIVHIFRSEALRAVTLAGAGQNGRCNYALIVSAAGDASSMRWWLPVGKWLHGRAATVVLSRTAELERLRSLGMRREGLHVVLPGVEETVNEAEQDVVARIPRSAGQRYVACVGPFLSHKGFYDALWAFDIVRRIHDNVHLLMVGAGSDRIRLQRFVRAMGAEQQVHWLGPLDDIRPVLQAAELVWVPSRHNGGELAALAALAAGRPVVASNLEELAGIVVDGTTGYLVPPGDCVALALRTRILLDDANLRQTLGDAGRRRVAADYSAEAMTWRFTELYKGLKSASMSPGRLDHASRRAT